MSLSRFAAVMGIALGAFAGCSSAPAGKGADDVGAVESDLKLSGTRYLGKIADGETKTTTYHNPPRYRSYGFDAKGGDAVTIDITSTDGDAVGYLTDASYNVLASNDDASLSTFDSKVTYTIPAGTPTRSYRIVFNEYATSDATFSVRLSIKATCTYDDALYTAGTTFPSTDGCNSCTCTANGSVACSKRACTCDPAHEPSRTYIGTPQQCMVIRYTCAIGKRPFQNNCGCGCEQI